MVRKLINSAFQRIQPHVIWRFLGEVIIKILKTTLVKQLHVIRLCRSLKEAPSH
jgi:hypothetical protein